MSVAYSAAVFWWFGGAIGRYTGWGTGAGVGLLLLAAPLLQPQFIALALVRHVVGQHRGPTVAALAGAAAWVAVERLVPRLLGDTLGYGLYPAPLLRQAADLGGAAGLTLALLLCHEALAAAWRRRGSGIRAVARPLALAASVPVLLAVYGAWVLHAVEVPSGATLRVGLVQSAIVDYERLRREKGAEAVVREVLDTHYAMTYDAVERQRAQVVLWSETVYPTTFGNPRSEAGAELDREILEIVNAAGVPFVFGTFERDATAEYNAAAFVEPGKGLLGFYRKARPFPITEHVPAWLDGPALRRWLPWAGTWQPGNGARAFPLRLADGREVPVLPLICLDDMDPRLAIDGARLGAQALLTLSNDSWFTDHPLGARLHLAAAAFRSIETRMPQFRVTNNGLSGAIDLTGTVRAGSRMGERTLLVAELPVGEPPVTLMVALGDWVGLAGAAFLALLGAGAAANAWRARFPARPADATPATVQGEVAMVPPAVRWTAAALRATARLSLLWIAAAVVLGEDGLRTNTLLQIRVFVAAFLAPEAAAWLLLRAFRARASLQDGALVLMRGSARRQFPLRDLGAVDAWRLPLPGEGLTFQLAGQGSGSFSLLGADAKALRAAARAAGAALAPEAPMSWWGRYAQARGCGWPGWLGHPLMKFGLLPLLLTLPAFRLHQVIAYGGAFGEYQTYGLLAYLAAFALWWAAWLIGVVLCAAVVRAGIELATLLAVLLAPQQAGRVRLMMERAGLAALYLGIPGWLLVRMLAS